MTFWQAFMSVYHEYPLLVAAILGCSLAMNAIFLFINYERHDSRTMWDKTKDRDC